MPQKRESIRKMKIKCLLAKEYILIVLHSTISLNTPSRVSQDHLIFSLHSGALDVNVLRGWSFYNKYSSYYLYSPNTDDDFYVTLLQAYLPRCLRE